MKKDFQEKIWMIIKKGKYVLNTFITELKIRTIFASKYISLSVKFTTLGRGHFLFKKNGVLEIFEE
jgi:hypothetical protein